MKRKAEPQLFAPLCKEGQFVSIGGKLARAKRNKVYRNPCRECQERRGVILITRCDLGAKLECTTKLGMKMYPLFIKRKKK